MNDDINIVMICDDGYVMPTSVAITSIIVNSNKNRNYIFYLLCDNINNENKKKLLSQTSHNALIKLVDVDSSKYQGVEKTYSKVTKSSLLKFSIPIYLANIKKALYLDGDIVVCKDIAPLYDTQLGDNYAAVISDGPKDLKNLPGGKKHYYYADPLYFNSGVMLLNLELLRKEDISQKLIDFRLNEYNFFMDQDAFNCIFGKNVIHMGVEYDFMLHLISYVNKEYSVDQLVDFYSLKPYKTIDEIFQNTIVFHYTFAKPWKYYDIPMNEIWMKYFYMSPFKDLNLNRCSFMTCSLSSKSYVLYLKIANLVKKIIHQ